jgi:hypothetical protein
VQLRLRERARSAPPARPPHLCLPGPVSAPNLFPPRAPHSAAAAPSPPTRPPSPCSRACSVSGRTSTVPRGDGRLRCDRASAVGPRRFWLPSDRGAGRRQADRAMGRLRGGGGGGLGGCCCGGGGCALLAAVLVVSALVIHGGGGMCKLYLCLVLLVSSFLWVVLSESCSRSCSLLVIFVCPSRQNRSMRRLFILYILPSVFAVDLMAKSCSTLELTLFEPLILIFGLRTIVRDLEDVVVIWHVS